MVCPVCGEQCPAGARFCPACGTALPAAAQFESRRVVTVVFCDVVGSTALADRLDAEVLRGVMNRYHERVAAAADGFGGTVEKFIGDAAVAVFGVPRLHEDDALRAVRAAVAMRDVAEVDVRIGIATGEVVTGPGRTIASGEAMNLAARLQQTAAAGEILLSAATVDAIPGAIDVDAVDGLELRGWDGSVAAFRLVRVTGDGPIPRRMDVPLVGRDRERRFILDAFDRVVADRACHLVTVLGEPGIGKSRLMTAALQEMRATARVLIARCRPLGESAPLQPLEEILHESGGPEVDDCDYDDALAMTREHFERLARERPLVVVFDDAHWAEPALLDLVDRLADQADDVPLLLLAGARPELFDVRAGWGGGKPNAISLRLAPLDQDATLALIDEIAADAPLEPPARRRVAILAEGNPLFAEQMAMVLAEGRADVPATIHALLAARLDALPPEDRELLERAAIEGRAFRLAAVAALGPCESEAGLRARLERLVERRILDFAPGGEFRFHHQLVRDAAYDATPKHRRVELHRAFADWLTRAEPRTAGVVGHHLAEAYRYRVELGLEDDEETADLAARAADALHRSGRRAIAAGDSATACEELERAARLGGDADPAILADLGVALRGAGRLDESAWRLEQAERLADGGGDERTAWRARVEWLPVARSLGRIDLTAQRRIAQEAIDAVTPLGDDLGLARAYQALGEHERALAHARAAGARREEAEILVDLGWQWVDIPTTVTEAIKRVRALLGQAAGNRRAEAGLAVCLARLQMCQGLVAEAEAALQDTLAVYRGLGRLYGVASVVDILAETALAAGDLPLAQRRLREAIAISERTGDILRRGFWLSRLGLVALLDGRPRDALDLTEQAERAGPDRDWQAIRAIALARLGDGPAALHWADAALGDGEQRVWPYDAGRGRAAALAGNGRSAEARAAFAALQEDAAAAGDRFESELTRRVEALFEVGGEPAQS